MEYRTITAKVSPFSTKDAIGITPPESRRKRFSDLQWIPKRLIHGGDLLLLERKLSGSGGAFEATFRVVNWKAEELGWA